jgi:hypothetical protein
LPTGGNDYATQRQRKGENLEKGMGRQALAQPGISGESKSSEKKTKNNMQEMSVGIHGAQGREILQPDLLGKVDVGERERKPLRVSGGREVCLQNSKREDGSGTSTGNGKTPGETAGILGECSSHQRDSLRQPDRESGGADKSEPCQDAHAKQFGHKLEPYTPTPAIVFDPFLGSGTTLIAARRLERRGVGTELSYEYTQAARERLMETKLDNWTKGEWIVDSGDVTDLPLFSGEES